jgi:4-carboxymuconolactone decarboxylase
MREIPKRFTNFLQTYPEVGAAYQQLGKAVKAAGPLDTKTQSLIKIGIAIASGLEGGTHSQTRKALDAGCTPDQVRHAAMQTLTTCGFPRMMMGLSWVEDVIGTETDSI